MERGPYAISCVISGAPSACRVIADRYRKYLHVTVRLKLRLDEKNTIYHIHNTCAIPTRNMPYPQEICHVHKTDAISTRQMLHLQHLCHICNTYAIMMISSRHIPYLQHLRYRAHVTCASKYPKTSVDVMRRQINIQYKLYSQRKCVFCVHAHKTIWHCVVQLHASRQRSDPIPKKNKLERTKYTRIFFGYTHVFGYES